MSDESFVKSWGSLPDDPLTLCGTRRFVRECRASLTTGTTPARLSVRPTVQLEFEPGRVVMTVEAELSEPNGRFGQVEAKVPANLRMIEVSAVGLENWSLTADGRLGLSFDGSTASSRRSLRLVGSIPVGEDPLKIELRPHRIPVPWIEWQNMEVFAGFLVASSISKLEDDARHRESRSFLRKRRWGRDDFTAKSAYVSRGRPAAARRDFMGVDPG